MTNEDLYNSICASALRHVDDVRRNRNTHYVDITHYVGTRFGLAVIEGTFTVEKLDAAVRQLREKEER